MKYASSVYGTDWATSREPSSTFLVKVAALGKANFCWRNFKWWQILLYLPVYSEK